LQKIIFRLLINKDVGSVHDGTTFSSVNNSRLLTDFFLFLFICHHEVASSKRGRKKNITRLKSYEKKNVASRRDYEGSSHTKKKTRNFFYFVDKRGNSIGSYNHRF
jgi:hypothetical protein